LENSSGLFRAISRNSSKRIELRDKTMTREREIRKARERERALELLCAIARNLTDLGDKLDDITVLTQQQTDLLRRILEGSERTI